jgi:hypothetical protein
VIRALPPALHQPFVEAFAVSLQPVFVAASGISFVAFLLTWWLREVPLRVTSRTEGAEEAEAALAG